ncbi:Lanosterol 14-alpha demethylase [Rhynchospora pubera]|uniref:Lanosterol 14-alpha demethylase n=1 Tax=Rhynchospora pubera TaxID=906938 RepID=A0AAV8FMT2_9POAL|nr:Lanosterol 14-alpha demethylase [Rhynchospora pubera]
MFGQSATFLIGPVVSKHFYTAPESELGKEMYKLLIVALFGPNLNTEAAIQLVLKGTRPKMLKCYVPQILTEAQDYFSKWQDCGTVDLVHEFERLITLAIARCLLGRDVREILNERIPALLRDLSGGILPISVLFPYLPIPAHNRRDKARDNLLYIIMNSRKNSPQPEEDFLQTLLEDGDDINSEQISAFILSVLFVGKHTTASTAVWTGAYLLQHKTYFSKVFEEQKELFGRHGLDRF